MTLIGAIETIGDSIAIQRVSWRKPQAPDYRVVAGAVAVDGVGNLLSGILGTVPNTTYSNSISMTELTGVASRRVGTWIGISFLGLALFPKVAALFLAIPPPVVGAFGIALIAILFSLGLHMVVRDGMNLKKRSSSASPSGSAPASRPGPSIPRRSTVLWGCCSTTG